MGEQALKNRDEEAEAGTREQRVNRIANAMYDNISEIENGKGERLLDLEFECANKISEIDPDSPGALKEMKELLVDFYDVVDRDFSFIVGTYDVNYTKPKLKDIQENLTILDEESIKENLKKIARNSLDSMNETAKRVIEMRRDGLDKISNSDNPLAIGVDDQSETATKFNNMLVDEVGNEVSDTLAKADLEMTTKKDSTGLKRIILEPKEEKIARHEEVPEFQKKRA